MKSLERYDDRDVIIANLIDSYIRLMEFGKKHLNDVSVLDGTQSVSARDKILREIVSNIFRITIPLDDVAELQVGLGNSKETNKEISDKIMDIMKELPEISVKDISEMLRISVSDVGYHVNILRRICMIEHVGSTKRGRWIVKLK